MLLIIFIILIGIFFSQDLPKYINYLSYVLLGILNIFFQEEFKVQMFLHLQMEVLYLIFMVSLRNKAFYIVPNMLLHSLLFYLKDTLQIPIKPSLKFSLANFMLGYYIKKL